MEKIFNKDIVQESNSNLNTVLQNNRSLTENSLRMRAMAYLAQVKSSLLTQTIFEVDNDRKQINNYASSLDDKNKLLEKQKNIIEEQKIEIEKLIDRQSKDAKIGHWRVDIESDTITCSKEILKMFDLVGHENSLNLLTLRQKVHPEDVEKVVASLQKAKKDSNYKHDIAYRVIKKDGSISWIHCREKLNSEKSLVEGTMLDITNLKNTQIVLEKQKEILLSQSKAAMMGEMIGLIAHQFRQPLSIISMLSSNELASLELEESVTNDQIRNSANETLNQVEYLSKTIETFRDFLHSDNKKVEDNIKNAIENSIAIVNKSLSNHNIELIKEYNSDIELYISNSELMQVFINLLNNSKDAFDINSIENRKIMIRTYDKDENVIIEIEDNAGGILQADIENIFDAYFTTKSKSGGTGLGLYIVQIIIKEHFDGTIEARNIYSDDKTTGVQFSITIPLK